MRAVTLINNYLNAAIKLLIRSITFFFIEIFPIFIDIHQLHYELKISIVKKNIKHKYGEQTNRLFYCKSTGRSKLNRTGSRFELFSLKPLYF